MWKLAWTKAVLLAVLASGFMAGTVRAADNGIKVKITAGTQVLEAEFLDNTTTRSLISLFPLTVTMNNLYEREMCYRFPDALPASEPRRLDFEVGDVSYWVPWHSLVIFYKQDGEYISNLQRVGHISSDVAFFSGAGDMKVTFELAE